MRSEEEVVNLLTDLQEDLVVLLRKLDRCLVRLGVSKSGRGLRVSYEDFASTVSFLGAHLFGDRWQADQGALERLYLLAQGDIVTVRDFMQDMSYQGEYIRSPIAVMLAAFKREGYHRVRDRFWEIRQARRALREHGHEGAEPA
jgi:hypothetical protein